MSAIQIDNISKSFGKVKALSDISLTIEEGELFGLIGPDGAGKTTLFRILTTLLLPDTGTAELDGLNLQKDYREIRTRVGYMPGRFSLYPDLSVEENLQFFAALFGNSLEDSYDLIRPIYHQIEPFRQRKAGKLSGGMKQKLALCCALIHQPRILFLDEPTTGVDAVSRSEFWDMLSDLKQKGITILVSTPYMDEASRCERIALCNEGRILQVDTPCGVVEKYDAELYAVEANDMFTLLKTTREAPGVVECYAFGESHHMVVDKSFDENQYRANLGDLEGLTMKKIAPTIEDAFIKLMKR